MTDQHHHSSEALFRFSVVSKVVARIRGDEPRSDAIRAVAADSHAFFDGSLRRISERSIYRWFAQYDESGMPGLEPKARHTEPSALSKDFVDFLVDENRGDRSASIPELIQRARAHGIVKPDEIADRSTVYRTCKRLGLCMARRKKAKHRDSRRFAYPHRMDMVLCDGKHFRAGEGRHKRVALFYIDDATRYVLHAVVGTSETQELFQRGVYECITKHGFMDACYVDHGPGFIAEDTIAVFAHLGVPLIHGEVGYKEGRGKIERFNRTAKADVLRNLDGRPDVDPGCGALELRLLHYTEQVYAHRPHESLDDDTPWRRFHNDCKPLRFPDDHQALRRKFEIWITRRVSSDHVVSVGSIHYEVPKGHAGRIVLLRRRLLDGTIGFLHESKVIDLHPVDLGANARAPRARTGQGDDQPEAMPRKSAADLMFQRDFGPVVDHDGGLESPPRIDDDSNECDLPW
jgi:transposase InsO family protein